MENIAGYFNDLADDYDALPFVKNRKLDVYIKLFQTVIPTLNTTAVLDIGCGTGIITMELRKHGAKAEGIDLSEKMIEKASAKAPGIFRVADFYDFNSERKYALAISIMGGVIGITESPGTSMSLTRKFFRKLNEILNIGGYACIEFLNLSAVSRQVDESDILKGLFLYPEALVFDLNGFYEKAYAPGELMAIAEEFGFSSFELYSRTATGIIPGVAVDSDVGILIAEKIKDS